MIDKNNDIDSNAKSDVISGRNPVSEAIASNRPIDKILVARGEKSGAVVGILAKARNKQIPIKEVDRTKLDYISGNSVHQGIIAFAAAKEYSTVDEIFEYAHSLGEAPFIVVLDEVEDPHNLGAIIRTAECAGVHGVILPKRRSASLSYTVGKASAGAIEYMRVARVTNIATLLDEIKARGVWVYGADMNGTDYQKCDFSGACAIVIGNEGKGISRLVRQKCDVIVSLPMKGKINSLNASVAAGILMYSAMNGR
jgi:23S rRNA (guanosine2251-2'-O)-methyltransferase